MEAPALVLAPTTVRAFSRPNLEAIRKKNFRWTGRFSRRRCVPLAAHTLISGRGGHPTSASLLETWCGPFTFMAASLQSAPKGPQHAFLSSRVPDARTGSPIQIASLPHARLGVTATAIDWDVTATGMGSSAFSLHGVVRKQAKKERK